MEKEFKTIEEQIEILKSKNIIIGDYNKVYKMLSRNNYYYLINGYKALFIDRTNEIEKYINNTKIDEIYSLYNFDKNIKVVFLKYLLIFNIKNNKNTILIISNRKLNTILI